MSETKTHTGSVLLILSVNNLFNIKRYQVRGKMRMYLQLAKKLAETATEEIYDELLNFVEQFNECWIYCDILLAKRFLTGDSKYLLQAAKICREKIPDASEALKYYIAYFQSFNTNEFATLIEMLSKEFENNSNIEKEEKYNPLDLVANIVETKSPLTDLYYRHSGIIYLIYFAFKENKFDVVSELKNYLNILKNQIEQFVIKTNNYTYKEIQLIQSDVQMLSKFLSTKQHHNDINYFAIELNQQNEQAYINIIDDLLTYNNYSDALSFYNNTYCTVFKKMQETNIINICWFLSNYFAKNFNFYKSLFYQKLALEQELGA